MARAQTYIITPNNIYGYLSDYHNDNHDEYINRFYSNLKITEYIPFLLVNYNLCVIDVSRHDKYGTIFLPDKLSDFQRNWMIERESYLSKFEWYLSNVEGNNRKSYQDIKFKDIIPLIKIKKQLY